MRKCFALLHLNFKDMQVGFSHFTGRESEMFMLYYIKNFKDMQSSFFAFHRS